MLFRSLELNLVREIVELLLLGHFLLGRLRSSSRCLERLLQHDSPGFVTLVAEGVAVVGTIRLLTSHWLLLITSRRSLGLLCGHVVWGVGDTKLVKLADTTKRRGTETDEQRLMDLVVGQLKRIEMAANVAQDVAADDDPAGAESAHPASEFRLPIVHGGMLGSGRRLVVGDRLFALRGTWRPGRLVGM